MAVCHYHPETPAIGRCMRCREPICEGCCTRLRGINHCHACLAALARPRPTASAGVGSWVGAFFALSLLWALLFGLFLLVQGLLAP